MGMFTQSAAGAFRYTKDGRRLYARRYLVPDALLGRVESRVRTEARLGLPLVIIASTIARQQWGDLWGWLAILLALPLGFLSQFWVAEGLTVVEVAESELEPVDHDAVALADAKAKGRPAMWAFFFLTVGMAALGGVVAFSDGDWYGWLLLLMMSWCAVKIFQQGRLLDNK